uniref:Glycosyltransferase family 92 protein n=1 Tax=viral metagenome TaxID=1070528 RepID=A0A6C0HYN4_9ZZZZ
MNFNEAIKPIFIPYFNIYDIFYNDDNQLVIIIPSEREPPIINYISSENEIFSFNLYNCPHNHTYIYTLNIEYKENVKLIINNNIVETKVNKYLVYKDEIIFSTIVKDEDDYVKTWIDFHLKLGIQRFIIYDNSNKNTLSNILSKYLQNNIVLLINWQYPYRLPVSGISGQTTQQNHSIYAFKNSKYIGLFDVDEYLNIQCKKNVNVFFEELILKEKIDVEKISSFKISNKFFYNPNNLPTNGCNFLRIFDCDKITENGREKNFVIPKNVETFSVHMVTSGKPMYDVCYKYVFFNHYYFLNKNYRGYNVTNLKDYSILLHLQD